MITRFEKWHGCKNDFMVIEAGATDHLIAGSLSRQASKLCARDGSGIGADGILLLQKVKHDDIYPSLLTIINSDGSRARHCGNGTRCAAASIQLKLAATLNPLDVPEALALTIQDGPQVDVRFFVEPNKLSTDDMPTLAVDMGQVDVKSPTSLPAGERSFIEKVCSQLDVAAWAKEFYLVDVGNRHVVFFCEEWRREELLKVGHTLQKTDLWDGINVHVAAVQTNTSGAEARRYLQGDIVESYRSASWERGVGPTQACGSGAVAIATAAWSSDLVSRDGWIHVAMPGGNLYVRQDQAEESAVLAGPAVKVYEGQIVW